MLVVTDLFNLLEMTVGSAATFIASNQVDVSCKFLHCKLLSGFASYLALIFFYFITTVYILTRVAKVVTVHDDLLTQ